MRHTFTFIMLITAALLQAACTEDPRSGIVGAWTGDSGVQDLRFHASGQAEINDHKTGRRYRGTCSINNEALMTCRFEDFHQPVVRSIRISGDELVLTSRNGQKEIYHRSR